jgi:hypothetical protein
MTLYTRMGAAAAILIDRSANSTSEKYRQETAAMADAWASHEADYTKVKTAQLAEESAVYNDFSSQVKEDHGAHMLELMTDVLNISDAATDAFIAADIVNDTTLANLKTANSDAWAAIATAEGEVSDFSDAINAAYAG